MSEVLTLLPQLWLSLLYTGNHHITNTSIRQPIQTRSKPVWFNEKQALCPAVVRTIQDGTYGQTERHAEFSARGSSTCSNGTVRWICISGVRADGLTALFGHFVFCGRS